MITVLRVPCYGLCAGNRAQVWSATRSAIRRPLRSELRTIDNRRPPRPHGPFASPRLSLWQLTTRPPRSGRSGSQLPRGLGLDLRAGGADGDREVASRGNGFVMRKQVIPGPGTLRVGQFIGRLGVVSLPAVEVGLDLDQRVVQRHVAKLEAAGWLVRAPWVWGEGSVVWLTGMGIECAGLGGARPVKAPPAPTTIAHSVLVAWSAARAERRGRVWKSARELAVYRERWAVSMRCERGYTEQLPDLAVWVKRSAPPVAVIAESALSASADDGGRDHE